MEWLLHQLVKLMGGEIVVDSLEGKGTDFTVFLNLPVAPSQEYEDEKEVVVEQFSFEKKRILLAEDNETNAEICMSVLNSKGAFVERVENGQEAVDTFKKHAKNYYDLILMDIQMPQMDGYEATQIIRTMESGKAIPIFALSADAYVENKRYSKEMGMDGHFSKPIDFDVMEKELSEYLLDVIKFDKEAGRLDETTHPFTLNMGNKDVRITTHYYEDNLLSNIFS